MVQSQTFYFSEGPYLQTLQGLHAALSAPEAFVKLLGGVQTGKSLLCGKLTQYMRRKGYQVVYFNAAVESPDMLRTILARELKLPVSSNFSRLLEDTLQLKDDKPIVLIFDDAHLLTDITLLEIYRLAEVQVDRHRVLNVLLSGDMSLEKRMLSNQEFKSMLLSVSNRFVLEPMDRTTLDQFFYRYAEKSGVPGLQLDIAAMNYLYKSCRGYPGPALSMCRLVVESRLGSTVIKPMSKTELAGILKSASSLGLSGISLADGRKMRHLAPLAAVVAIVSIGFMYQQLQPGELSTQTSSEVSGMAVQSPFLQAVETQEQTGNQTELAVADLSSIDEAGAEAEADVEVEVEAEAEQLVLAESEAVNTTTVAGPLEIPEPVSDSSLALVTAEEIGISSASISEPVFEALAEEEANGNVPPSPGTDEAEAVELPESVEQSAPENSDSVLVAANADVQLTELADQVEEPDDAEPNLNSENSDVEPMALTEATEITASQVSFTDQLESAVRAWLAAWQSQSLKDYFASYHSQFSPRYQDDIDGWRENRQRVIGNADTIELEMSEFQHLGVEEGLQDVRFWLRYQSANYSDNTQKKLLLDEEGGVWKIVEEINLQVRR